MGFLWLKQICIITTIITANELIIITFRCNLMAELQLRSHSAHAVALMFLPPQSFLIGRTKQ